ncbi:MAG: hypothetical protein KDC48_00080 [Planctomycetes bacterium]|nr:hypothetical protein [Planctomycetota bacterium]
MRIGDWWLGCARLAITQRHSRQPVQRRGGRFAAVLNGAITNARELWAELLPRAERRREPPNDAWLPLLAVERGRRDLLARMRGHHAFAVVDAERDELVLGQDRFGEKPLFCVQERGRPTPVAFASVPSALRPLDVVAESPPARIAQWFRFGFAAQLPQRVRPAARLVPAPSPRSPGEPSLREPSRDEQSPRAMSASKASTTPLRQQLQQSVARCIDTQVPVGLQLSGGLDSSCLAACLAALDAGPLPAFQFHAAGEPDSERRIAIQVAERCGLQLHRVDGGTEVLDALPGLTAAAGVPLGDPSILAVHAVARCAAAAGVRVLLGGEGADERFAGYRRYRALQHLPHLPWLRRFAPTWSNGYVARWLRAATAPDPAIALLAVTPPAFARTVLSPDLARRRVFDDAGRLPGDDGVARGPAERARTADLRGYLRWDLLPKVDVATMAAGVESRCPYLEGDFAHQAPAVGKVALRQAFAEVLPAAVMTQPKRGFALPLDRWFRSQLPWLDLLADARTRQREHLRPGGLAEVVDRHRSGRADLGHGLYLLVAHELFLRTRDIGFSESGGPA